jgi:Putative abortive phage resistance protein AbiGi, antitoxin
MVISVSSSVLFHCWHGDDTAAARYILESICQKGLLLTTNAATLDSFAIDRGKGVVQMEVMQHPRVCFTDIPIELLAEHGQRYGKYGVGFRRETIIDWGGLPAWYLPNYWGDKSLKVAGAVLVNGLHAAMDAAEHLRVLAVEFRTRGVPFTVTYKHGPTMKADQLANELQQVAHSIFLALSFIKEMSPPSAEDYSYLFEREWRLVGGFGFAGLPSPFRTLTLEEKDALCARRPVWREKRQSHDINITARYGETPVIDSFQYFNGLPGKETVAQLIDTILVPDEAEAQWVRNFVAGHPSHFGASVPKVITFPVG